jgi:hypothetical protein
MRATLEMRRGSRWHGAWKRRWHLLERGRRHRTSSSSARSICSKWRWRHLWRHAHPHLRRHLLWRRATAKSWVRGMLHSHLRGASRHVATGMRTRTTVSASSHAIGGLRGRVASHRPITALRLGRSTRGRGERYALQLSKVLWGTHAT